MIFPLVTKMIAGDAPSSSNKMHITIGRWVYIQSCLPISVIQFNRTFVKCIILKQYLLNYPSEQDE